jgi:hypothetical protein
MSCDHPIALRSAYQIKRPVAGSLEFLVDLVELEALIVRKLGLAVAGLEDDDNGGAGLAGATASWQRVHSTLGRGTWACGSPFWPLQE